MLDDQDFTLAPDLSMAETYATFWTLYPRHEGKKDGFKAWNQLRPDAALVALILTDLRTRTWPTNMRFVPLPATYLRGYRWTDEPSSMVRDLPANRWMPAQPSRLIKGGMGIWCEHDPPCETDLEHYRLTHGGEDV
jgi:hypothetical protein